MDKEYKAHEAFTEIIKDRGLKRVWIAKQIGVSPSHLTNMLKGKDTLNQVYIDALNIVLKTKIK